MMDRRSLVRSLGSIALGGSLAGCSSLASDDLGSSATPTAEPEPEIAWTEHLVSSNPLKFSVTVDVELDGASMIQIHKGAVSGSPMVEIRQSGTYKIAGQDGRNDPIGARMLMASIPKESDGPNGYRVIEGYNVGSQTL